MTPSDANIFLDWYTIYYGIKNNYLKNEIANQFVISDMEKFISYMPITDNYIPIEHTKEENENRLLANLDSFINGKLKEIKKS